MSIDLRFSDVNPPEPDAVRTIYCDIVGLPNPMYLGLIIRAFNEDSVGLYMQLVGVHPNWTFTTTNLGLLGADADSWYRINQFGYRARPSSETVETIAVTLNAYTDAGYSNLKWTFSRSIAVFMFKSDDLTWDLDEYDNFDDGTIQGWAADTVENPPANIDVNTDFVLSPIYALKANNNSPTSFTSSMWLYKSFMTEDKDLVFAIANLRYDESMGTAPSFSASIRVNGETVINLDPILDKWHHLTFPLPRNSTIEIRFYFSGSSASHPWWLYMWLDDFRIISKDRGELPAIDLSQSEGVAFYWWGSGGLDQNIDFEMWSPTGGWVGRFPDGPAGWRWVFLKWSVLTEVDLDGSRPDPSDIRGIYWTYHTDGVRRINYIVGWRTQDLYGSFEIRQPEASQELFARFEAQVSLNLLGRLIVRHSDLAELFSRFTVRQDSADLFCRFEVGQSSADLFGKVKIIHPDFVELFGKCNIAKTIQFSLREHKTGASDPNWVFSKPSPSICRAASNTSGVGNAYMFFNVSREYIHGKYIRITWQGDYTHAPWGSNVCVYDGFYDRNSDVDFPSGAGMLLKGNGLLQTGLARTGDFGPVTEEFLVDVSGGVLPNVMIMIRSRDAWSGHSGWIQVDTIEINSGAGGSGALYREPFNDSITMEKTGTIGDYGYISEGGPPKAGSRELYARFTVNP